MEFFFPTGPHPQLDAVKALVDQGKLMLGALEKALGEKPPPEHDRAWMRVELAALEESLRTYRQSL